jgi:hypothetical protein
MRFVFAIFIIFLVSTVSYAQTAFESVIFIHAENVETGKTSNVVFTVSQWEQFQKSGEQTFTAQPEKEPVTVTGDFDPVIWEFAPKGRETFRVSTRNSRYNN